MDAKNLRHHHHSHRGYYGYQILGDQILVNRHIKSVLFFAVLLFFLSSGSSSNVLADPIVKQVTTNPAEPRALSTITFNATVLSDKPIKETRILIQECRNDMCFVYGFNISMMKTTNNTYQVQCTLMQKEATQFKYYLIIATNETLYITNTTVMPLVVTSNNNTTQEPVVPGFEISLLVLSIVLIMVFDSRRRKSSK